MTSPSPSSLMPNTSTVKNPRAYGYHARIGSVWYRLVTLGQQVPLIQTAEAQPTRVDTSANPEDFRPVSGLHFSLSDTSGGEGQDFAHRQTSSPNRFWDSWNVDVSPTDPGQPSSFRLLTAMDTVTPPSWSPPETSGRVAVLGNQTDPNSATPNSPTLFVADEDSIRVSTNPLAVTPTFTEEPLLGPVLDIVSHDGTVFASVEGEGTYRRLAVNSWEKFSDLAPLRLWSVKGRLLGGDEVGLHEVREDATSDLIRSIPNSPDFQFTSVVDGGEVVLASSHSSIHMFTVGEDLALVPDAEVRVAESEQVTCLAYSVKGVLLYGTREPNTTDTGSVGRLYRATVSQRSVSQSVLIRQWGTATSVEDSSPATIHLTRESAYTAIHEPGRGLNVWRYDLGTTGRVREHPLAASGRVRSIASLGDRLVVSVSSPTSPSLHRESTSTATSGYLISPLIDHHSAAEKSWGGLMLDIDPSPGFLVEVWYSGFPEAIHDPDHPSWRRAARASSSVPNRERPIDIPPSRYLALMVKLVRVGGGTDPNLSSPPLAVNSVTTRSNPRNMELVLSLPVNISDHVNVAGRGRVIMPGVGRMVYRSLQGLEGASQYVELLDPAERIRGTVEEVTTPVQALDSAGAPTLVCHVRIRGVRSVERLTTLVGPLSTYHLLAKKPLVGGVTT